MAISTEHGLRIACLVGMHRAVSQLMDNGMIAYDAQQIVEVKLGDIEEQLLALGSDALGIDLGADRPTAQVMELLKVGINDE